MCAGCTLRPAPRRLVGLAGRAPAATGSNRKSASRRVQTIIYYPIPIPQKPPPGLLRSGYVAGSCVTERLTSEVLTADLPPELTARAISSVWEVVRASAPLASAPRSQRPRLAGRRLVA